MATFDTLKNQKNKENQRPKEKRKQGGSIKGGKRGARRRRLLLRLICGTWWGVKGVSRESIRAETRSGAKAKWPHPP